MNERTDIIKQFTKIWIQSRYDAGASQEDMALALGVSRKTIQNWEKGTSSPSLFQGFEWFRVLGLNPLRYYLNFIYPEFFHDLNCDSDDEKCKQALIKYIDSCSPAEHKQLLYLIAGKHGSDWYAVLQMMTAHCHCSMQSRVCAARIILDNYDMDCSKGSNVCPDSILPDTELLEQSILKGKSAAIEGKIGYSAK